MDLLDLLVKGYFPEELPPPFTTEDMGMIKDEVLANIDTLDPIAKGKKMFLTKMTTFSIPKIKAYRRTLGIPQSFASY